MKDGKKKDRSDRSVWRGERCVGRFSQLPTLLWILRFKGLVFFLRALRGSKATKENDENDRFSFLSFFTCFNILSWFQKKEIGSIVFPHLNKAIEEEKKKPRPRRGQLPLCYSEMIPNCRFKCTHLCSLYGVVDGHDSCSGG